MLAADMTISSRALLGTSWTKPGKKPAIKSNHESSVVEVMESRGMYMRGQPMSGAVTFEIPAGPLVGTRQLDD